TVSLESGQPVKVLGFVAVEPKHDLALIRTEPFTQPDVVAKLAEKMPEVGERLAGFGSPKGLTFSTTEGIVSAIRTGQEIGELTGRDSYRHLGYSVKAIWIQTTTQISPGNSGGPLVNMNAEVVGLNTWSKLDGQSLNFAIALTDIKKFLDANREKPTKEF